MVLASTLFWSNGKSSVSVVVYTGAITAVALSLPPVVAA